MLVPKSLRELLGPSQFSAEGFLGADERTPEAIIKDDETALQALFTGKEAVASALRDMYVRAERALGNPITLAPSVTAVHEDARGRITSPFPSDGTFQKGQVKITESTSGLTMLITPLSIHLIEKHGFFQGRGSRYRIEPADAVKIIKLFSTI